jgi:hypothetical protein
MELEKKEKSKKERGIVTVSLGVEVDKMIEERLEKLRANAEKFGMSPKDIKKSAVIRNLIKVGLEHTEED